MNLTNRPPFQKGRTRRKRKAVAVADDEAFRVWVQRQPSCISGRFSEYVNGEGRCVAAHVRRASTSGTGFKGLLSCVPLTDAEHQTQHRSGELDCLALHLGVLDIELLFGGLTDAEAARTAKRWFDTQAAKYRERWLQERKP